jgi:hypothetical protein
MIVYLKDLGIRHQRREKAQKESRLALAYVVSAEPPLLNKFSLYLAVDTEELSHRESFFLSPEFEGNQAEVDDEFIRSSPYPPPANQRFAAYCVFNGRLTGVFRTWSVPFFPV